MGPSTSFERLRSLCAEVGFDLEDASPAIRARMALLAETTSTVEDSERCVDLARDVFRHYETSKPLQRFTELERRIVVLGTLFADIGKTGPAGAPPEGQRLIAEIFAVENVPDERMSVARFFEVYFPADAGDRTRGLGALGLDPRMTMRALWNLHSAWTLRVIRGDGVPSEAVPAAAAHHLLENVNPDAIVAEDGRFTKYFGAHASFDRPEKLVILLDKYDAVRRRGHGTHGDAIARLRAVIAASPRFGADRTFFTLIEDLDAVGRSREETRGLLART
jgi:hypothetical protein